jgi:2-keto-4-pentenoate hydratase/2-oxohepta-3-ene-1,7-dioic acid hydratase in catechol pathway
MRLLTIRTDGGDGIAAEAGRDVIALGPAITRVTGSSIPEDMAGFIEAGPELLKRAAQVIERCVSAAAAEKKKLRKAGVILDGRSVIRLAPLRPRAILCSGHNYWEHRDEKPPVRTDDPEYFLKLPQLVTNPGDPVVLDHRVTHKLDHETELAIVIGRHGRHIPVSRARSYVFGYTIMNDVTARDQQIRRHSAGYFEYYLGPGKNFDTAAPLGPCITTADEIPDPQSLNLRSFVNSEPRQNSSTAQMIWGVDQLVAFFSKFVTLRPGYLISSGTPGRTAWGWDAELGGKRAGDRNGRPKHLYLRPGDVVRCEIEKIGILENPIILRGKK